MSKTPSAHARHTAHQLKVRIESLQRRLREVDTKLALPQALPTATEKRIRTTRQRMRNELAQDLQLAQSRLTELQQARINQPA